MDEFKKYICICINRKIKVRESILYQLKKKVDKDESWNCYIELIKKKKKS